MFNIVLFQPQIPPNTGNIIRLCANTGCILHLIHPLGFELDEAKLRRAGLDYHEWVDVRQYDNLVAFQKANPAVHLLAFSTHGQQHYSKHRYQADDALLFGPETKGLPINLLDGLPSERILRLPMRSDQRSLNLSNTVSVVVYEAWRQLGFPGGQ